MRISGCLRLCRKNAFRGGTYSLAVAAVVLAILIAVNVFVSALPAARTQYDMSATKLYSVTSNTKVVVNALEENVTLYWVVQSGEEDAVVENLLSKYESLLRSHPGGKENPDVYPTFAQQYTDEEVPNNSIIVECGDRSRFISYHDIYIQDMYASSFDGEGAITSAIDYVVREELPQVYLLEGHGEAALPDTFRDQIRKGQSGDTNAVPADRRCSAGGCGLPDGLRTVQRSFGDRGGDALRLCCRRREAAGYCWPHGERNIGEPVWTSQRLWCGER